jgi:RNA polymerase sigma-70 factor (ECF subfamily)
MTVDEHVDPLPGRSDVAALLAHLDDDRRAAFVLTQLSGFGYHEAAGMLGVPIGTIRSRVARAREQMLQVVREAELPSDSWEPPTSLRRPG